MHVVQDDESTRNGSRDNEAHIIPGLGPLQYGFPDTIITKLRYCDVMALTGTAGAIAKNVFVANGIFDPDFTGTGHQPLYRDQYAGIYDNYVVLGSKIKVGYQSRTNLQGTIAGIVGDNDTTISSTLTTLLEQNNSVHTLLSDPGGPIQFLFNTFSPRQMIGVDAKDDGSSFTPVGSNPTDIFCWSVWIQSTDGSSTEVCDVLVEIEYTVKFAQLSTPVQN